MFFGLILLVGVSYFSSRHGFGSRRGGGEHPALPSLLVVSTATVGQADAKPSGF